MLIFQGADYCLAGLSFVITGVLDSLEREEAEEIIKKYGGRILHQISKKTNYVIIGDEPGPAKVSKVILIVNILKFCLNLLYVLQFTIQVFVLTLYRYIFRQIV